jgi:hypothetical protein
MALDAEGELCSLAVRLLRGAGCVHLRRLPSLAEVEQLALGWKGPLALPGEALRRTIAVELVGLLERVGVAAAFTPVKRGLYAERSDEEVPRL